MLTSREFWSFRVIHAVLGGLLTVGGACSAIVVDRTISARIKNADDGIARAQDRIGSIERTLAQFRIVQSNGVLLGALTQGEAMRVEYRRLYVQLMFTLRRGPTLAMLGELYNHDVKTFQADRAVFQQHIDAASSPNATQQSWQDVVDFEMSSERKLMDLQDAFRDTLFKLQARKRADETTLSTATLTAFVVQQIGFVIVLMAGLLYQYGRPPELPSEPHKPEQRAAAAA
jgi:hypothetical protein